MESGTPEKVSNQLESFHAEVARRVESAPAEKSGEELHQEVIHETVGEKLGKPQGSPQPAAAGTDLPQDIQASVQAMVNTAVTKDLDGAIAEARKHDNPMVVDAFHDALVGELYERLVSEGKLKQLS